MKMIRNIIIILVLPIFFLFTTPSTAEIKYSKIQSDESYQIFFQNFGFTDNGYISVATSSVSFTNLPVTSNKSPPDPSRIGFYLLSTRAQIQFYNQLRQNPNLCVLDSKFIILFTFKDHSLNKSYNVTYPDLYSLYFANCIPLTSVTMDVRTELYNIDGGTTKDYLSVGKTQLPSLYFIFFLMYLCFLGVWIWVCLKKRPFLEKIHFLMGVLLVIKALYLICTAEDQRYTKVTGTPLGWDVNIYFLYMMIVLINGGWWVFKCHEGDKYSPYKYLFYIVVFEYFFIRFVIFAAQKDVHVSNYKYEWVGNAAEEMVGLVFFMVMFYNFSPFEEKQYVVLKSAHEMAVLKNEDQKAEEMDTGDMEGFEI